MADLSLGPCTIVERSHLPRAHQVRDYPVSFLWGSAGASLSLCAQVQALDTSLLYYSPHPTSRSSCATTAPS